MVTNVSKIHWNFRVDHSGMLTISNSSGIASSGPLEFALVGLIAESV
jgi:hypothetical protein